ncbi:uncharacterized protein LOC106954787 isoform X2 [Poecilia latipinna]|uniref:uncharacterized protein LOC106954787 isoform X2 n=1 Tax=Poecilia latipinna TaxID=48699 RepID=UPI00072D937D|nr:PREDICTED: uncharacterized protein LOC106954787 isoform X2 [Poecilia latipinna]
MDPHRIVWAVMVCLLGATRLSSGANCTCLKIPPKNFTVQKDGCFEVKYRYECIPGYTRKSGTSGLIRCQEKNGVSQWGESKFECIINPIYWTTTTRVPSEPSSTLQSVRTSTYESSASPNTEQSTLGPSSTLQSVSTSTSGPSKSTNTEQSALGGGGTAVCISFSLIGLILFLAVGSVIFLYRQRKNSIPPRDLQELEIMKC